MNIHSPHGLWLCTGLTFHQCGGNLNAICIVRLELADLIIQLSIWSFDSQLYAEKRFCASGDWRENVGEQNVKKRKKRCGCRLRHGSCGLKWKRKKDLSSGRHGPLVIYINGAVPLMSCQGQAEKVRNKQCLKSHPFHSERVYCFVLGGGREEIKREGMNQNRINRVQSLRLTLGTVISIPIRNINSAMKRLMHRFLWMVLRSLCRPRKKQKVKMLMVRQTRDTTIPTRVMTFRSSSCTLSLTWEE